MTRSSRSAAPVSRRAWLRASLLAPLSGLLHAEPALAEAAASPAPSTFPSRVLVCVFLRGAADGLNIVVPHGDAHYYRARPTIAVPRPGSKGGALDLDGYFGLHPKLAGLKEAYDSRELALVHAVGSPHPTRSHFEAQEYMETGVVGERATSRGWLSRYVALRPTSERGRIRAVGVSARAPLALRGYADAVVAPSLGAFRLSGDDELAPSLQQGFRRLYGPASTGLAGRSGARALETSELLSRVLRGAERPAHGAKYARDAQGFADVARLVKADVGLELSWIDVGGWDTHRRQGAVDDGDLPRSLERLGRALSAFRTDLGPRFAQVAVLVMSEFGRTVNENGTSGTDHGHGGVMLVLGGGVGGGRVLGRFPGLAPELRYEGRDLEVTTDFRQPLSEVMKRHLGLADSSLLFPGFTAASGAGLGLFPR